MPQVYLEAINEPLKESSMFSNRFFFFWEGESRVDSINRELHYNKHWPLTAPTTATKQRLPKQKPGGKEDSSTDIKP